jgi:DNA-binding NtrC family response regulator
VQEYKDAGFSVAEGHQLGSDAQWGGLSELAPDCVVTELGLVTPQRLRQLQCAAGGQGIAVFLLAPGPDGGTESAPARDAKAQRQKASDPLREIVPGSSRNALRIRERIGALARLRVPVLIAGEPGTGHDTVARALHDLGLHPERSFLAVTLGSRSLGDAGTGTLYIDRVERLSLDEQKYVLSLIQRLRGERDGPRLVFSTEVDLALAAQQGKFLRELCEQLHRLPLRLPSVAERIADLPDILNVMLERIGAELRRPELELTRAAIESLCEQRWPNNLRDLYETLEKLAAFCPDGRITAEHVEEVVGEVPRSLSSVRARHTEDQRQQLMDLIGRCGGNLAEVARQLSISRGAVIYRAQKFGLLARRKTR